jgi:hypothetical protein
MLKQGLTIDTTFTHLNFRWTVPLTNYETNVKFRRIFSASSASCKYTHFSNTHLNIIQLLLYISVEVIHIPVHVSSIFVEV